MLRNYGPFTIFAPVDAAFANVNVSAIDTDALIKIIRYHVAPGFYNVHHLTDGMVLNTDAEETITVSVKSSSDDAHVPSDITLTCNNDASTTSQVKHRLRSAVNGIVYVIETLLAPGDTTTTTVKPGSGQCSNSDDIKSIQKKGSFLQESLEDSMGQLLACKSGLVAGFFRGGDCALLATGRDCAKLKWGFPQR
jgi:hypothetical protein